MTEPGSPIDRLRRAVAYALTGTVPTLPATDETASSTGFDPAELINRVGGVPKLRTVAAEALAAGRSWPYPVPDDLRAGLSAAQLHAAIQRARALIDEPPTMTRRQATPDSDDLRLIRDVPPHHGG